MVRFPGSAGALPRYRLIRMGRYQRQAADGGETVPAAPNPSRGVSGFIPAAEASGQAGLRPARERRRISKQAMVRAAEPVDEPDTPAVPKPAGLRGRGTPGGRLPD